MTDAAASADPARSRASWIGFVVGIPIMLFGIGGALVQSGATHPVQFATWLVGADLLHDVLVAPAVCLIGFGLSRDRAAAVARPARRGARDQRGRGRRRVGATARLRPHP